MEEELVIKSLTDEDIVVIVTRDKESMNPLLLGENTTFDEFKREVLSVSQLPDIHMLYIDEEGDAVCLDCEDEFLEAWKLATSTKQLNVLVEPVVKKPHPPRPLSPPRFHHPKPYSYLSKVIGDERRKKAEEAARALLGKPKCTDDPKPVMFGEEPQPVWLGEDPEPGWFKNAMRKHTYKVIDSVKKSLDGAVIASIQEKSLIPTPLKGLDNIVVHHGIVCDVCDNTIVGIRYKCGNCVDYDLCESCEEKSQFVHYEEHVFLKMRRPFQYAGLNRKGKRKPLLKRNIYHPMILPYVPNTLEEEAIAVLKTMSKEKPLETLLPDKGKKEGMVRRSKEKLREDLRRNRYHKKHHKYEETRREPEVSVEMIKKSKVQLRHELYAAKQQKKLEKTLHNDESHDITPTHHDESHDIIPTHHDESHDITPTHHEKSNDITSSLKGHGKCLDATFISDTSYSDDAIISYGNAFKKGWIIENTGTKTWKRVKLVHQDGFRPEEPELEVPDLEPGMQAELIVDYPAIKPTDGIDIKSSWRLIHNGHTPFGDILWLSVIAQPDPAQQLSSTFEHIPYPSLPPTKDNDQYSLGFTAEIISSSSTPPVGEEFTMVETPTPILSLASNDSLFYTPVEGKIDSEDDTESLGQCSDNDFFVVIPSCFKLDVPLTDFEPPINEPLSPVKTPPSLIIQQSTQHNDDTTSTPDIKDDNVTTPPVISSPETQQKSSNFIPNRETLDQAWISRSRNPVRYALGFVNTVTDLMDQHVHFTPPQVKTIPTTNEKQEEVVVEEEDEEDEEEEEQEEEEEEQEQEVPQPSAPPLPIPSHADISNLFQQDPDVARFLNRKWDGPKQPVTPMDRLISMGFANRALNSRLLKKYNNNLPNVIHELLDTQGEGYQAV